MIIRTKAQCYHLYESGAFGNKLTSYSSVDEYLNAKDPVTPVGLRYKGSGGGAQYPMYSQNLYSRASVVDLVGQWVMRGAQRNLIVVSETSDDSKLVIQGEIMHDLAHGYSLTYSTAKMRMREALAGHAKRHLGPGALLILQAAMSPSSYADLEVLMERYPEHAIEFSTFSVNLGNIRGRNTIFWEVRFY